MQRIWVTASWFNGQSGKKRTKGRTNGRTDTTDRITFDAVTVGKYSFELILYQ